MASYKISSILIGLIIISLFAGVFAIFMGGLNEAYPQTGYNNTSFNAYNQLNDINSQVENIQGNTSQVREPTGVLDRIGGLFSSAYSAVLVTTESYSLIENTVQQGIDDTGVLGESSSLFRTAIIAIIIIIIFVGIILSILLKREM